MVDDYKRNEASLKEMIVELREAVRVKEKTLESVQTHAGSQLDAAQRELERIHRDHEQELTRLRAMLRKTELKVISLQESLDQKVRILTYDPTNSHSALSGLSLIATPMKILDLSLPLVTKAAECHLSLTTCWWDRG